MEDGNQQESIVSPAARLTSDEPDILFGQYKCITKQQILSAFPPRAIVDRLVAEYFLNKGMAPGMLP